MRYIPTVLLLSLPFPQSALFAQTGESGAVPTAQDEAIRRLADEIDRIPYVVADLRQTIVAGERTLDATGKYRVGPDLRRWYEFEVDLGDAIGKRLYASDGTTAYQYEKLLDQEIVKRYDLREIKPLLDRKQLPIGDQEHLMAQPPFVRPGDMLRGHLKNVSFTSSEPGTLGTDAPRRVTVYEGRWKDSVLPVITGNPALRDPKKLPPELPQFVRLYLDEQTGWPLRVELFRRDDGKEDEPIYALEFLAVEFPDRVPDSDFQFTPPESLTAEVVDHTPAIVETLRSLPDKPAAHVPSPPPPTPQNHFRTSE